MADITLQEAYNRAKEALEAGEVDRAVAICQHVLRYYPRYVEGYRLLGEAYLERGNWAEAGRLFSHVLSCDPQSVLSHVGRAIIAEERRMIDVAIAELERGFEIDPSIGELRSELLRLYQERYGTAGASIHTTPIGLAYTHLRAGLLEQAIAEFLRITAAIPQRWDSQVALLEAFWRHEQLIDTATLAGEILAAHPNCVKANWILGYLHWTQGKLATGREYLTAAVALDPDYNVARKLWANTPWALDAAVTREQSAPVPNWAWDELVVEEDLDLALPLPLAEEPVPIADEVPVADEAPAVADEAPVVPAPALEIALPVEDEAAAPPEPPAPAPGDWFNMWIDTVLAAAPPATEPAAADDSAPPAAGRPGDGAAPAPQAATNGATPAADAFADEGIPPFLRITPALPEDETIPPFLQITPHETAPADVPAPDAGDQPATPAATAPDEIPDDIMYSVQLTVAHAGGEIEHVGAAAPPVSEQRAAVGTTGGDH